MLDPTPASPCPICRRLRALACLSVLGLCASPASALPPLEPGPAPGPLLAQGEPPGSPQPAQEDRQAPFDALNQVLEDTWAKLEELAEAAATAAADTKRREELQALERDNERLAAELAQANTCRIELERSSDPQRRALPSSRKPSTGHVGRRTPVGSNWNARATRRGAHCRAHGSRRQGTSGGGAHR
jgi:hypothetical protein